MLCRFVFGFWWSLFVWRIWFRIRPNSLHIWSVDRHTTTVVNVQHAFAPIAFANVSLLWLDSLTDQIQLDLVQTTKPSMGAVSVEQAIMNVYTNGVRDTEMERYPVSMPNTTLEQMHLTFLQQDSHYSPFRRLRIEPKIEWSLGGGDIVGQERVGHFKDGRWYEGEDPMHVGGCVLFAWGVGMIFLIVMRRPNNSTIIVAGRRKRVFNNGTVDQK